jgi:hypothetical protein
MFDPMDQSMEAEERPGFGGFHQDYGGYGIGHVGLEKEELRIMVVIIWTSRHKTWRVRRISTVETSMWIIRRMPMEFGVDWIATIDMAGAYW